MSMQTYRLRDQREGLPELSARRLTPRVVRDITALPAPPLAVQRLLMLLHDPEYSASAVAEIIQTDPALAGRVLKLANAPLYGCVGAIGDVPRAVVMLGATTLRTMVSTAGVMEAVRRVADDQALQAFWRHAAYCAAAASVLAHRGGRVRPEEALLLGLIHDIGELALRATRPQEMADIAAAPAAGRIEIERRRLGLSHPRAGQILLTAWNLPEHVCEAVRQHHSLGDLVAADRPALAVAALADALSVVAGAGSEEVPTERQLVALEDAAGLGGGLTAELLHEIDARCLEVSRFLDPDPDRADRYDLAYTDDGLRVAPLVSEPRRAARLRALLAYHHQEVVDPEQWLATGEAVDLVLLDPAAVSHEALADLAPLLLPMRDRVALYGRSSLARGSGLLAGEPACLPLLFSREQLLSLAPSPVAPR
jgi:HD-like signal output (HDOD) protein